MLFSLRFCSVRFKCVCLPFDTFSGFYVNFKQITTIECVSDKMKFFFTISETFVRVKMRSNQLRHKQILQLKIIVALETEKNVTT